MIGARLGRVGEEQDVQVVVVGAGIIGLLAAHALVHRGHAVAIHAAEAPAATTSATAGASFKARSVAPGPVTDDLVAMSRRVLEEWDRRGFSAALGVTRHRHVLASDAATIDLPYADRMDDVVRRSSDDGATIRGGFRTELSFRTWYFDVPSVLPAVVAHVLDDHGVAFVRRTVGSLGEVGADAQVVVNATGMGARELVDDERLEPIRGQGVVVPFADPPDWSVSADGFYAYPRDGGLFLGGTAEPGAWDRTPDPAVTRRLVAGNARVFPALADLPTDDLEAVVGLRPYRHGGVRLDLDRDVAPVPVVHAYGHGGAGWTLAPGTAVAVADLVERVAHHG